MTSNRGSLALPSTPRELAHTHDVSPSGIVSTRFLAAALNMSHLRIVGWGTLVEEIPSIEGTTFLFTSPHGHEALVERDGLIATVDIGGGSADLRVAATTTDAVEEFIASVREVLPQTTADPEAPTAPVTFWSYHPMGVRSRRRQIAVPPWTECAENYSRQTFAELCTLMDGDFQPGAGGQLLLWNGPAGTGKTHALRSLAWEWRDWCRLHYITDPEVLFGDNASYMLDVLLNEDDSLSESSTVGRTADGTDASLPPIPRVDPRARDGRWRLLVLEDTGEMMSADARERAGQGLGRLLNVADGLIGQGLRILILVTTNEKITRLHPAVSRAGRCASSIYFSALPSDEARDWLTRHGIDPDRHRQADDWTIADLYAIRNGAQVSRDREPVGLGFTS